MGDEFDYTYEGPGDVWLPECLTDHLNVSNSRFVNCNICGPAVVAIQPTCKFAGGFNLRLPREVGAESAIWPVPEELMLGVIGMNHCRFENVTWTDIGFVIADEAERQKVLESVIVERYEADMGE